MDAANDLYKLADKADDIKKSVGSYEIAYKSRNNYIGKGGFDRALKSAKRYAKNGDEVVAIRWKSSSSNKAAFIDEYLMQKRFGGVKKSNNQLKTYNIIWSPGKKYYLG